MSKAPEQITLNFVCPEIKVNLNDEVEVDFGIQRQNLITYLVKQISSGGNEVTVTLKRSR